MLQLKPTHEALQLLILQSRRVKIFRKSVFCGKTASICEICNQIQPPAKADGATLPANDIGTSGCLPVPNTAEAIKQDDRD